MSSSELTVNTRTQVRSLSGFHMGMTLRDTLQTRIEGKLLTFLNQKEATSERRTVPKEDGCPSRGSASTQRLSAAADPPARRCSDRRRLLRLRSPCSPTLPGDRRAARRRKGGLARGPRTGPGRACCAGSVPPFGGTSAEGRPRPAPLRGTLRVGRDVVSGRTHRRSVFLTCASRISRFSNRKGGTSFPP